MGQKSSFQGENVDVCSQNFSLETLQRPSRLGRFLGLKFEIAVFLVVFFQNISGQHCSPTYLAQIHLGLSTGANELRREKGP